MSLAQPKRILIIKLRHHGDVLLSTPVVDALKTRFPDCEIDMLV
ncbi:putative lipopolysaccharide heptosyltransferase III, partial [Neisseria sp. P0021.S005]